jgi:chromosome segregation ATPase
VSNLLSPPAAPLRLLDDVREIKELVRDLLATEEELTRTSRSMDHKISALDTANDRLAEALDELRSFNAKLDKLDGRMSVLEREIHRVRSATDEIKDVVPDLARGPLAKAKEALTGE